MPNLEKELKNVSKTQRRDLSTSVAVTETQRLIADKGAEDMDILRSMGMHSSVMKAIELQGRKIELESLENKYGQIFTFQEIRSLALRYGLRFLRSDSYKGSIDPEMLAKMKEFFGDAGIEMNKAKLGYNFFILAPYTAFNMKERENKPVPPDPILFYKLDESNYRLIHKWGADLTWYRRIIGWKYRYIINYLLFYTVLFSIPVTSIVKYFTHSNWSYLSIVGGVIFALMMACVGEKKAVEPHSDMWLKPEKNRI